MGTPTARWEAIAAAFDELVELGRDEQAAVAADRADGGDAVGGAGPRPAPDIEIVDVEVGEPGPGTYRVDVYVVGATDVIVLVRQ